MGFGGVFEMTKKEKKSLELPIHYLMALCGGFFGAYAIASRMGNLGQAQTANLIELVYAVIGRNPWEAMFRLIAMLVFVSGMVLATVLEKKSRWNLKYLSIALDIAAALALGLISAKIHPVVSLYPIFFASAFQWCVFKGAKGYVSSTLFCTNNLKQTTVAAVEYLLAPKGEEGREEKKESSLFFGGTMLSFYLGVAVSYVLWLQYGLRSIWFNLLPLLCGLLLVRAESRERGKSEN